MDVGVKFQSFSSLLDCLKAYENETLVKYYVRESKTLENQIRKFPTNIAAEAPKTLKYYYLKYCCIKGGKKYKPNNSSRETYTFRNGCAAHIDIKLTKCGQYLEIVSKADNHNHPCTENLFKALTHARLNLPTVLRNKVHI